jgi:hypothetical protein
MDTLKNKSMRCVVKMNNIRHFTLFTFGFFVGCNRVMSSFSVLWVYPFSILCRWRHYATILQWMACFLEAISKQPQCSEDASKVKERLAHIWISSSQLTTSLCQFGRQAKVGSTFHRRLSGRNLPPSSPFFILLFYGTDRSIQCRLSTAFGQEDHCRAPYLLWCGQDFAAADHHHPLDTLSAFGFSTAVILANKC